MADSHAGLPTEQYRDLHPLDRTFHPQFEDFLAERAAVLEQVTKMGIRGPKLA